ISTTCFSESSCSPSTRDESASMAATCSGRRSRADCARLLREARVCSSVTTSLPLDSGMWCPLRRAKAGETAGLAGRAPASRRRLEALAVLEVEPGFAAHGAADDVAEDVLLDRLVG